MIRKAARGIHCLRVRRRGLSARAWARSTRPRARMSHRKRKRRARAKTAQKAMRMAKASATKRKVTTCTPAAARKNCPAARLRAAMLPMVIGPIHMVIKAPRHSRRASLLLGSIPASA